MRKPIFTVKNRFSHLSDIPGSGGSFSLKWKRFLNQFFIPACGNKFLSSRNSIVLFRALLKILKFQNFKYFFQRERVFKRIFHSLQWGQIFCHVQIVFSYLILFFLQLKIFTEISGNKCFWGKGFVPVERDFPPSGNCLLLFCASFLQVETVTETIAPC